MTTPSTALINRLAVLACLTLLSTGCRSDAAAPDDTAATPTPSLVPVRLTQAPQTPAELALPLVHWTEKHTDPEPMAIHVLRVDLRDPELEVIAMLAPDPDGDGPAEAALADPVQLATQYRALAAVNANSFEGLPGPDGTPDRAWRVDLPVDILGVAVNDSRRTSGPNPGTGNGFAFWVDSHGAAHIGPVPAEDADVAEAVNAWCIDLVADGKPLPQAGGDRHPRTAVGLSADRRWLFLVVVDGRQPKHSVWMTARELADLMASLGADRAINLDGGGSSIMLTAHPTGRFAIVNRPSDRRLRPIPVLLGVRSRTP